MGHNIEAKKEAVRAGFLITETKHVIKWNLDLICLPLVKEYRS